MAEQYAKNKSDKGGWRAVNALSLWSGIKGEQQHERTFLKQTSISPAMNCPVTLPLHSI